MKVRDWMTPHPEVIEQDRPLTEARRWLQEHPFRHLPVVDRRGKLVGVLADYDVFGAAPEGTVASLQRPARLRATPNEELWAVLARHQWHRDELVVVTDTDEAPVGVLTEHDTVRLAARMLDPYLRVDDVATRLLDTYPTRLRVSQARNQLEARFRRHLLVTEGVRLVGVLSYRDLVRDAQEHPRDRPLAALVEHRELVTASWGTRLTDAAHLLADRRIGCLPLTTADQPEGVVTRTDLSRALLASASLAARAAG